MEWIKPITHKEVICVSYGGEAFLKWFPRVWVFCGFDPQYCRYAFKVLWSLRNKIHCGEMAYNKEFRISWKGWPIQVDYYG